MYKCENCDTGEYKEVYEQIGELINPNGEYVKGYGRNPVIKMKNGAKIMVCQNCGHKKGEEIINI